MEQENWSRGWQDYTFAHPQMTGETLCHSGLVKIFTDPLTGQVWRAGGSSRGFKRPDNAVVIALAHSVNDANMLSNIIDLEGFHSRPILYMNWSDGTAGPLKERGEWEHLLGKIRAVKLDVAVSCMGGHGRTGTFCAIMGHLMGVFHDKPVQELRDVYCKNAVESESQFALIAEVCGTATEYVRSAPAIGISPLYDYHTPLQQISIVPVVTKKAIEFVRVSDERLGTIEKSAAYVYNERWSRWELVSGYDLPCQVYYWDNDPSNPLYVALESMHTFLAEDSSVDESEEISLLNGREPMPLKQAARAAKAVVRYGQRFVVMNTTHIPKEYVWERHPFGWAAAAPSAADTVEERDGLRIASRSVAEYRKEVKRTK